MVLILASTSVYRRELLGRLAVPFEVRTPLIDEEKEKDPKLPPQALAEKLAFLKARDLAGPGKLILGGDQLVSFQGRILGKPGSREKAVDQLIALQGHTHELITALCLVRADGTTIPHTDITRLSMKKLTRAQIEKVVDLDQPWDCAGAYKIEAHGLSLMESIETSDFTAIQGLPLIALARLLQNEGLSSPSP